MGLNECLTCVWLAHLDVLHSHCLSQCPGGSFPCSLGACGVLHLIFVFCLLVPEVLFDPCRTWCPASTCQAVCQLQDIGIQTPQLVQCKACDMEFCSACKARWHPGQGCPETMPITFLPGESRYRCVGAVVESVGRAL